MDSRSSPQRLKPPITGWALIAALEALRHPKPAREKPYYQPVMLRPIQIIAQTPPVFALCDTNAR
jgi:hypothetical protein